MYALWSMVIVPSASFSFHFLSLFLALFLHLGEKFVCKDFCMYASLYMCVCISELHHSWGFSVQRIIVMDYVAESRSTECVMNVLAMYVATTYTLCRRERERERYKC